MKNYSVGFRYSTFATIDVEAKTKEEAEDKVRDILFEEGIPALTEGTNDFEIDYSEEL